MDIRNKHQKPLQPCTEEVKMPGAGFSFAPHMMCVLAVIFSLGELKFLS